MENPARTDSDAVFARALVVPPELPTEVLRPSEAVDLGRVEQVNPVTHAIVEHLVFVGTSECDGWWVRTKSGVMFRIYIYIYTKYILY